MEKPIRNKVAEAGLITVDLLDYSTKKNIKGIDLKDWLINDLIIKEADFKNKLDNFDFFPFENCNVYIYCSKDVIIPVWAFLLLQVKLNHVANYVFFGTKADLNLILFKKSVDDNLDLLSLKNKRVFIKGCGDPSLPLGAFSIVSEKLIPIVKSLFYGEACSNVPLIKNM